VSTPPKPIPEVLSILKATPKKRVLLVEGIADEDVYTTWLKRLASPDIYSDRVIVVDCGGGGEGGGRGRLLKVLEWFRDNGYDPTRVVGIADRDFWDADIVAQHIAQLPHLRIDPGRHALESYFCDPDELVPAVLGCNPAWGAEAGALRAMIDNHRADYLDHWALCTTTERAKDEMTEHGYPGAFVNQVPIPSDTDIQQRFKQWSEAIDADAIFDSFQQLRATATASSPNESLRSFVWAKKFYEDIVHRAPDGLNSIQAKNSKDWMVDLAQYSPGIPASIEAILQPLLA
jgi:hypothetical protein